MKIGDRFLLLGGSPQDIRTVAELHTDGKDGYSYGVADTLGAFHYFGQIVPVEEGSDALLRV